MATLSTANCRSLIFILYLLLLTVAHARKLPNSRSPHIVFIVADDLGWNDVGWHNSKVLSPRLDALARDGLRFNQYYVQPVCTPSRAAFMTGYYPYHLGLQYFVIEPLQRNGLPLTVRTLPQTLKQLGYDTHMVGKWHLGFCKWEYTPTYRGFDSFYGFLGGLNDHFTHHHGSWADVPASNGLDFMFNTSKVTDQLGVYSAFSHAKRAEDIIKNHDASKPLYLYLPFQNVHAPLQAPQEYINLYSNVADKSRRTYLAMVTALDVAVGRIIDALSEKGIFNNTFLVFTTDNGGSVNSGGNNWPLRGSKHSLYEGGTRGVAFAYGSMLKNHNFDYQGLFHAVDWVPTLVEAAGGGVVRDLDGISHWKSLIGSEPSPRQDLIYNLDDVDVKGAIRDDNFKLIVGDPLSPRFQSQGGWFPPPEGELYRRMRRHRETNLRHRMWRHSSTGFLESYRFSNEIPVFPDVIYRNDQPTLPLFGQNVTVKLYNLASDPTEHHDISSTHADDVNRLYNRLLQYGQTLVPARYPPESQRGDPKYWGNAWGPGWC